MKLDGYFFPFVSFLVCVAGIVVLIVLVCQNHGHGAYLIFAELHPQVFELSLSGADWQFKAALLSRRPVKTGVLLVDIEYFVTRINSILFRVVDNLNRYAGTLSRVPVGSRSILECVEEAFDWLTAFVVVEVMRP